MNDKEWEVVDLSEKNTYPVEVEEAQAAEALADPDPDWATEQEYRTMLDDEVVAEPVRPRPVVQIADGVRGMEV